MRNLKISLAIVMAALSMSLVSCKDSKDKPQPEEKWAPHRVDRAMFLYLAADNSINSYGYSNINLLIEGATRANIGSNGIFVYHDRYDGNTRLLAIYADRNGKGKMDVVYEYDENKDTSDPEVLKEAVAKLQHYMPADHYVMAIGSHASGWYPSRTTRYVGLWGNEPTAPGGIMPMSVAQDGSSHMQLEEFSDALAEAGVKFDMIIFDECNMGGVEVAYEMRDKADYVVSSVSEVPIAGMPYARLLPHIFSSDPKAGAKGVATEFFDEYKNSSGIIAAWDCSKFDDDFVQTVKTLLATKATEISSFNLSSMQYYDFQSRPERYFDFQGFMDKLYEADPPNADKDKFDNVLGYDNPNGLVIYKATTNYLFNHSVDAAKYSGVSTYIPMSGPSIPSGYNTLTTKYKDNRWFKEVYPAL